MGLCALGISKEQFSSIYMMEKFFLVVTFLAAISSPVLKVSGEGPPELTCEELKEIDSYHPQLKEKCGDEGDGYSRSFGAASAMFSGGNRNTATQVIYDSQCNDWYMVGLHECPIAFNFAPYEDLCEAGSWWRKEWGHTEPLYVLKSGLGTYFCRHTPRFFCPILGEPCSRGSTDSGSSHGSSSHGGSHGNTYGGSHGSQWNNLPFRGTGGQNQNGHQDGHGNSQNWW